MQTRRLGNSDLEITRIGFGAWAIGGGGWAFAWGPQDDAESIATIHRALDAGMNWIDTAAVYGLGHSEEIVARALQGVSNRPYIFTKCGMIWNQDKEINQSLKADSIRRECEASLRRLNVEAIDLYQIHWPVQDADIEEGWAALAELKKSGKVRYIGVSNFDVSQMKRAQAIAPITSLQPPYSLVNRAVENEILPYAGERGIGVIAYSPMGSGLLTGAMTRERIAGFASDDWRRRGTNFQEPQLSKNLRIADKLKEIAGRHGRTPADAAVAWVLRNPHVTAAIVGARRPGQIEGFVHGAEFALSATEVEEIDLVK